MHINWVTNAQLCDIIRNNLWKLPRDIDGIICVPRGGLFVGSIIAEFLHKPLYTPTSFLEGNTLGNGLALSNTRTNFNKYLVIDDSTSSGNSFKNIQQLFLDRSEQFIYVAAIGAKQDMPYCDIILDCVEEFRLFELNFFRSSWVCHCIFDIDGVLCKDPQPGIDLDEEKYINHLNNVEPLYLPQFPILSLCSHRLMKYASQTQQWLKKYNIEYNMLYLLDFNSIEEKLEKINSPELLNMKSWVYKQYPNALMFVESNFEEAKRIFQNTNRPILCIEKNIILQ